MNDQYPNKYKNDSITALDKFENDYSNYTLK